MVLELDGNLEHGAHIWYFDLLKAFGYIERVVKPTFFLQKRPILLYMCATCPELPSYISTIVFIKTTFQHVLSK